MTDVSSITKQSNPDSPVTCIACGHVDEPEKPLEDMTYEEVLQVRFQLNQKLQAVADELAKREAPIKKSLEAGEKVPGFKLKKGRKSRSIVDDKALARELEAAGILRSSIYSVKLKGVPDLEKLIRAQFDEEDADKMYAKHIKETLGKPTLEYVGE
ncbi:hypothetical protein VPHD292_0035 [Vibrio phage D292]